MSMFEAMAKGLDMTYEAMERPQEQSGVGLVDLPTESLVKYLEDCIEYGTPDEAKDEALATLEVLASRALPRPLIVLAAEMAKAQADEWAERVDHSRGDDDFAKGKVGEYLEAARAYRLATPDPEADDG